MKNLWKWAERLNEIIGLPLAILLFFVSPAMIRWADPNAAFFSADYLHSVPLAGLLFLSAALLAYGGVVLNWRGLHKETIRFMSDRINNLPKNENTDLQWKQLKLYAVVYFAYFLLFLAVLTLVMLNIPIVVTQPALPVN